MKTSFTLFFILFLTAFCSKHSNAQGGNDCSAAQGITVPVFPTAASVLTADLNSATQTITTSCQNANPYREVWYEFTASHDGNLRIFSTNGSNQFALYASCGATELACFAGAGYFYGLGSGTTYQLAVSRQESLITGSGMYNFNVQGFNISANDECSPNPHMITLTAGNPVANVPFDPRGATESLQSSCDAGSIQHDLWYEIDNQATGNIRIFNTNGNNTFTFYDVCGGSELICFSGAGYYYNAIAGTTYWLKASRRQSFATGTFDFNIEAYPRAVNDECSPNPHMITLTAGNPVANVPFDPRGATESLQSSCDAGSIQHDLWYEIDNQVTGNIRIFNTNGNNTFTLYDVCGGSELICFSGAGYYYNAIAGTTYWLKASRRQSFATGTFNFNIEAYPRAVNDECSPNPHMITLTAGNPVANVPFDPRGATESLQSSCDAGSIQHDLWYEIDNQVTGNIRIFNTNGNNTFTFYDVCGGSELICFSGAGYYYNAIAGTTYWLKASRRQSFATGTFDFNIEAYPRAINDECVNAIMINVATIENCSSEQTTVDYRGATDNTGTPACLNTSHTNLDLWYSFEAPISGNIQLNTINSNNNFAIYDACSGTELACFSGSATIPGLIAGNTYLLQTWRRASLATSTSTFCLEAFYDVSTIGSCTSSNVDITNANGNTNEWVPILDGSGDIMAAVNANGNELGTVTASVYIDVNDTRTYNSNPYLRRALEVTTTEAGPFLPGVSLRMYLTDDELTDLVAADPNLNNIFGLNVLKSSTLNCSDDYDGSSASFIIAGSGSYGPDHYLQFSTTTFSTFFPTSSNISQLPLVLISFSGHLINEQIELNWSTASEINGSHFEVHRSLNGYHFERIGIVKAVGESQNIENYFFIDETPSNNLNYYKLKQVDIDGSFDWSETVAVSRTDDLRDLIIFPNPASGVATLTVLSSDVGKPLSVYDTNGSLVQETYIAQQTVEVQLPDKKGLYFLRIGDKHVKLINQ